MDRQKAWASEQELLLQKPLCMDRDRQEGLGIVNKIQGEWVGVLPPFLSDNNDSKCYLTK